MGLSSSCLTVIGDVQLVCNLVLKCSFSSALISYLRRLIGIGFVKSVVYLLDLGTFLLCWKLLEPKPGLAVQRLKVLKSNC